jgi:hypothetical protein
VSALTWAMEHKTALNEEAGKRYIAVVRRDDALERRAARTPRYLHGITPDKRFQKDDTMAAHLAGMTPSVGIEWRVLCEDLRRDGCGTAPAVARLCVVRRWET